MTTRSEAKRAARLRILDASAARLRGEGLEGASVANVMSDAGLTHGAFYSHFLNKDDLSQQAFRHAVDIGRPLWTGKCDQKWSARMIRLARSYLTRRHRDNRSGGCPFAALGVDAARASEPFRGMFGDELVKSIQAITGGVKETVPQERREQEAIRLMALCVGGMVLARGVSDPELSGRILDTCRNAISADDGSFLNDKGIFHGP